MVPEDRQLITAVTTPAERRGTVLTVTTVGVRAAIEGMPHRTDLQVIAGIMEDGSTSTGLTVGQPPWQLLRHRRPEQEEE